jgi:bifunctional non-homologous end joining protein LigD
MSLTEYKRKRDFKKTPEPAGKVKSSKGTLQFVVQKHAATRLHYDFRLELDGTLKSWAVPKGPSLDPSVKALAVQVEDHPLDYAGFEGVIPEGQYGGGTVMVWDRGTWEPEGDEAPSRAYKKGRLKFALHGDKLKGSWALVRMGGAAGEGGKNWLLIKHNDKYAKSVKDFNLVEKKPKSVVSKRTMEQIAAAADRVWSSNHAGSAEQNGVTDFKARLRNIVAKKQATKTKTVNKKAVKKEASAAEGVKKSVGRKKAAKKKALKKK